MKTEMNEMNEKENKIKEETFESYITQILPFFNYFSTSVSVPQELLWIAYAYTLNIVIALSNVYGSVVSISHNKGTREFFLTLTFGHAVDQNFSTYYIRIREDNNAYIESITNSVDQIYDAIVASALEEINKEPIEENLAYMLDL